MKRIILILFIIALPQNIQATKNNNADQNVINLMHSYNISTEPIPDDIIYSNTYCKIGNIILHPSTSPYKALLLIGVCYSYSTFGLHEMYIEKHIMAGINYIKKYINPHFRERDFYSNISSLQHLIEQFPDKKMTIQALGDLGNAMHYTVQLFD